MFDRRISELTVLTGAQAEGGDLLPIVDMLPTPITKRITRGQLFASVPGITLVDGTAAAPAYAFAGQTNTGIYRPATSVLALSVNGTERARFTTAGMQVTGLISGTAVTQSVDDTTAGRLLKVGDFGLGEPGNAGTQLTAAGAADALRGWRIDRVAVADVATVGGPAGAAGGTFMTIGYSADNQHQFYFEVEGAGRVFQRFFDFGWTLWRLIYTQGSILGTVSQTGGVPTGAVLQGDASAASPAGGYSQRLANGFQQVHHVVTSSSSADTTVTFTNAFLAGSSPCVAIASVGDADQRPRIVSISPTAVVFSIRDSGGARIAVPVHLTITGRWSNMT
jgi:hypothetical protein